MNCIYCKNNTRVVNSRPQKRQNKVWRRRSCLTCGTTFTSIEAVDMNGSVRVRDVSSLQPFKRDKLLLSIHDSLRHRKTALDDASALTDSIIAMILPLLQHAVVEKPDIVRISIQVLKRFDKVAATHYEAFHPLDRR